MLAKPFNTRIPFPKPIHTENDGRMQWWNNPTSNVLRCIAGEAHRQIYNFTQTHNTIISEQNLQCIDKTRFQSKLMNNVGCDKWMACATIQKAMQLALPNMQRQMYKLSTHGH